MSINFSLFRGGQCIWEAGCWLKMGEGGGRRGEICLGCGRLTSYRDVGGRIKMITRRRDVAEKQVWDAGGEGKNVWDVGMPIIKTMGGGRQVKKVKKVKNNSGRRDAGGRVKMAVGGGMQDKNEAGGGMLHPCVPPPKKKDVPKNGED